MIDWIPISYLRVFESIYVEWYINVDISRIKFKFESTVVLCNTSAMPEILQYPSNNVLA